MDKSLSIWHLYLKSHINKNQNNLGDLTLYTTRWGFERCLAKQHEFVEINPLVGLTKLIKLILLIWRCVNLLWFCRNIFAVLVCSILICLHCWIFRLENNVLHVSSGPSSSWYSELHSNRFSFPHCHI